MELMQSGQRQESLQPGSLDRVRSHTSAPVNERIDLLTRARTEEARRIGPARIGARLAQLDREWDVDRALVLNFTVVGGTVCALGLSRMRANQKPNGWFYMLAVQLGLLAYHAVAGWCPPLFVFRRMGFRTHREIEVERRALEAALGVPSAGGQRLVSAESTDVQ